MNNSDKPINPLGLTKREYFAAAAMQGMLANPEGVMLRSGTQSLAPQTIAEMAVNQADELLNQLEQK